MKPLRSQRKMFIHIGIALLLIIAVYIVLKLIVFMPSIKGEDAVASIDTVEIGGIMQSMLIRSQDVKNPILLYLHSGPGSSEMVSFRTYQSKLEEHFTVVLWEQRGTGKSYSDTIGADTMTIDMMVSDAGEVIQYLLDKFKQQKLFVVGHSWGSLLGVLTIQEYPQYIYAYVGSGQIVKPDDGEKISYAYALNKAFEQNNRQAIKELQQIQENFDYLTIAENANWYEEIITQRKWLVKFGGETYNRDNCSFMFMPALMPSEYTLIDFIKFSKGSEFSLKTLWPQVMKIDLLNSAQKLSVPVFLFQGRHDYNTPSSLVEDYFEILDAPYKELIWFEESGHHPMYEESESYQSMLVEKLLPLASEQSR